MAKQTQTQIQIEKPTRSRNTQRTGKGKNAPASQPAQEPAQEPAQAQQEQITQEPAPSAPVVAQEPAPVAKEIKHFVHDYARPRAGAALFAHTQAFLELSGLTSGKAYPKSKAAQVIGQTAVKYHMGNGNFEQGADGLKLTPKGTEFFKARGEIDKEFLAAYTSVFTTGEVNDKANAKTPASIGTIK